MTTYGKNELSASMLDSIAWLGMAARLSLVTRSWAWKPDPFLLSNMDYEMSK